MHSQIQNHDEAAEPTARRGRQTHYQEKRTCTDTAQGHATAFPTKWARNQEHRKGTSQLDDQNPFIWVHGS